MIDAGDLPDLTKEKLVALLEELNIQEEEVMASLVVVRQELLDRLVAEKKDGERIGEYAVSRAKRITFKTSLEIARELGAVKDALNTDVLRKLYYSGVKVPDTTVTEYLSVRRLSQEEAEK